MQKAEQIIKSKTMSDISDFINLHFKPEDNMFGYIPISTKEKSNKSQYINGKMKKKKKGLYGVGSLCTNDLSNLERFNIYKSMDYYISANSFNSATERNLEHLFTFHNIVIDIDCHNRKHRYDMNRNIECLKYFLNEAFDEPEIPTPNTIVKTGRGLQIWWAINPVSYKAKSVYDKVRKYIISRLDEVLSNEDTLKMFNIDKSASNNYVGLFRMPGSINNRVNTPVTYDIINTEKLDIFDFASDLEKDYPKIQKRITNKNLYAYREKKIYELVDLRNGNMNGCRDKACLILHSAYMSAGKTQKEANEAILKLNESFTKPMNQKELLSYMSSSSKKNYKFTNEKIIEFLDISEEEQNKLNFHTAKDNEKIRKEKRENKKTRNQKIIIFHLLKQTQNKISKTVGCSQPTICRVIKKYLSTLKKNVIKKYKEKRAELNKNLKNVSSIIAEAMTTSESFKNLKKLFAVFLKTNYSFLRI